jgi:hypothetical protein
VNQKSGRFQPDEFEDQYETAHNKKRADKPITPKERQAKRWRFGGSPELDDKGAVVASGDLSGSLSASARKYARRDIDPVQRFP